MGSCLSKKGRTSAPSSCAPPPATLAVSEPPPDPHTCGATVEAQEESVKKEIFVIKHSKIHQDTIASSNDNNFVTNGGEGGGGKSIDTAAAAPVRTSSCTKEEVDAILIQCGRLSRSSSGKAARKYSGSKRSYDFDHRDIVDDDDHDDERKKGSSSSNNNNNNNAINDNDGDHDEIAERQRYHRQRHRQPRASSHERRRTPSREREQQRSGSRDRDRGSSSGNGRTVSRSPGRRSETPPNTTSAIGTAPATASANIACATATSASASRPGKMVSVPATVSSLAMDKSKNELATITSAATKRISLKRNAGEAVLGSRSAASPRSQSPVKANQANVKVSNENLNDNSHQQPSLSRSSSRKVERSPYRRNPLSEIDTNSLAFQQLPQPPSNKAANNFVSQAPMQKPNVEEVNNSTVAVQGTNIKGSSRGSTLENKVGSLSCRAEEQQQQQIAEAPIEPKGMQPKTSNVEVIAVASGNESLKSQTLTRSRSSRRSRDLDLNPETLLNPAASYTTLLLEDIQNFHQKKSNSNIMFSLPPCVTKACSILEAVADLNSCTSSNLSCGLISDDMKSTPLDLDQSNKDLNNFSYGSNLGVQEGLEAKDPFVESELVVDDDIMEPSLHKYVTVRRGTCILGGGGEMEEQESSGSNSFVGVGGTQHQGSSSSWEPNSADSTDCWTLRSNAREEDLSPLGFQRYSLSGGDVDGAPRRLSARKRISDHQQTGISTRGSGRAGATRGLRTLPTVAAAAST